MITKLLTPKVDVSNKDSSVQIFNFKGLIKERHIGRVEGQVHRARKAKSDVRHDHRECRDLIAQTRTEKREYDSQASRSREG